jgi:hypothetical protein
MKPGLCLNSRTPLRRAIVRIAGCFSPLSSPWLLTARQVWKVCGFLEWLHWRAEELAMELEMRENETLSVGTLERSRVGRP